MNVNHLTIKELCSMIEVRMDPNELVETLDADITDLVWRLEDLIDERRERFRDLIDDEGYEEEELGEEALEGWEQ